MLSVASMGTILFRFFSCLFDDEVARENMLGKLP